EPDQQTRQPPRHLGVPVARPRLGIRVVVPHNTRGPSWVYEALVDPSHRQTSFSTSRIVFCRQPVCAPDRPFAAHDCGAPVPGCRLPRPLYRASRPPGRCNTTGNPHTVHIRTPE